MSNFTHANFEKPPPSESRRNKGLLLFLGPVAAFEFVESAIKIASENWEVRNVNNTIDANTEPALAVLVACDRAADPEIEAFGRRADAPLIVFRMASPGGSDLSRANPKGILSLSDLSAREFVEAVKIEIDRWRHSRLLQENFGESDHARQSRSEFLSAVNHEVRTPLNAILGMAETLLETELDPPQTRFAEIIRSSGEELLRVLDQLVDLSRLRGGNVRIVRSEFDLRHAIRSVAEIELLQISKNVKLRIEVDPRLPRSVIGPSERLRDVLETLVACCARQMSEGEITVGATLDPTWQNEWIVRFSVEHSDAAIAPAHLAEVFEAFATDDPPISRDHGGIGISLALAVNLVRAMGGEFWSEEATRRLCFSIPLQAIRVRPGEANPAHSLEGVRICMAISHSPRGSMIQQALEDAGAFVIVVASTVEAVQSALDALDAALPLDLLLLEDAAANDNAVATLRKQANEAPRVAVLSAGNSPVHPTLRAGENLGAGENIRHIRSDAETDEVIRTLGELAYGMPPEPPGLSPTSSLEILVADDSEDNRRLIETFLAKEPHNLHFVADGREAVNRFREGDFDLILMDIQMPILNGHEATREIRGIEKTEGREKTPVVALTAFAFDEDVEDSLQSGCDLHITKPIRKKTLVDLLAKFASNSEVSPVADSRSHNF